jgi:hypothetical protein
VLILAINPFSGRGHATRQAKRASAFFSSAGISAIEVQGQDLFDFVEECVEADNTLEDTHWKCTATS